MSKTVGKCNLCNITKPLQKKSHVISKWIFKKAGVFDGKNRMLMVNLIEHSRGAYADKPPTDVPDSPYEQNILCEDCDRKVLGALETEASKVLFTDKNLLKYITLEDDKSFDIYHSINYTKFKLFILSLIWRASLSKHLMFVHVNLDAPTMEELREMIFSGNAKTINDYPFFIKSFGHIPEIPPDSVNGGMQLNYLGMECIKMQLSHYFVWVCINNTPTTTQYTLKDDNLLYIQRLNLTETNSLLMKDWYDAYFYSKNGRWPEEGENKYLNSPYVPTWKDLPYPFSKSMHDFVMNPQKIEDESKNMKALNHI